MHDVLVAGLPRDPVTRRLDLRGLSAAAVGRQLAALVGRDVTGTKVTQVHAVTGGNPFFVSEMGRLLAERGPDAPVTATVRAAIHSRLDALSPGCVGLLQAASIAGREFSVPVVAAMLDRSALDCLGPLDEALAAGLVEVAAPLDEHRFPHVLVRDAIEAGLPTTERVRWHRAAAAAVETVHRGRIEPHLSDLARHWAVAAVLGERERAARWIERAADEAMRRLAYEEAARFYRLALGITAGHVDALERCRLLLALAGALRLTGERSSQLEACREAAGIARARHRPDLVADAALRLESGGTPESDLTVKRLCEEALAGLGPRPTPLRARLTARLSDVWMYLNDLDAAGLASEEALAVAQQCGDPVAAVAALRARQLVRSDPDGVDERARLAQQLLAVGRSSSDRETQLWAHLWRIDVLFQRGDLAGVARELEVLGWCVEEVRGPVARWQHLRCRAALAQAQARFDDALRLAHEGFAELSPTGQPSAVVTRNNVLSLVGHHVGHDASGSVAAYGLADTGADAPEFPTAGVIFSLAPAFLLADAGRLAEAAPVYRRLGPVATWRPLPHVVTVSYAFGIAVAAALDLLDDVAALRERLAAFRGHHVASGAGAVVYQGPVELYLGTSAAHLGLHDAAVADLESAASRCAVSGAAAFQTEARCELATALAHRSRPGDLPRARALAADVVREARRLGMTPFVERATRLQDRLDSALVPLTPREREVAELVAQGLTNREIATRLYLSERTAQNHVQHILTKLGLSNRSQIAVWITERT